MNAAEAVLAPALQFGWGADAALVHAGRTFTYDEVVRLTNRTGHGLRALGVRPGQRVLLMLRDSPEWVCTYLAAMKLGAVAVPLNLRSSAEELAFCLADSQATVAVLDAQFLPLYFRIASKLDPPPALVVHGAVKVPPGTHGLADVAQGQPDDLEPVLLPPDEMAFWIYTSGTTGDAKAAVHRQRDVLLSDAYLRETLGVTRGTRLFATSKLFFAYALGTCLFGAFRLGATSILHGDWPTPPLVRDQVAQHRPDIVFSVPALYRTLLRAGVAGEAPFRTVRTYVSAGEKLPESVYRRWHQATGVPIVEGMGTSETIYMFLTNRRDDSRPGSCGVPAPGAEVRLVDEAGNAFSEADREGMLQVRMDSISDRYWNREEPGLRQEPGIAAPWFSTGDRFTVDAQGRWTHRGRRDDMLKLAGQWVNPADLEERLLALPSIADAAVVGVGDDGDSMRLALYAVPASAVADREGLEQALRTALTARLPELKHPLFVRLVAELPRTASSKVQRFRIRQEAVADVETGRR
jgi:benzoate-CoA ligase